MIPLAPAVAQAVAPRWGALTAPAPTLWVSASSLDAAAAAAAPLPTLPSGAAFGPVAPATPAAVAFVAIAALSWLAYRVWETQVVPVSRANLARSKRAGPVRAYLDELRAAGDGDDDADNDNGGAADATVDRRPPRRALERWLFADWLRPATAGARTKAPALPWWPGAAAERPKWNSGDNPVLVATALILLGVTLGAALERLAAVLPAAGP